MSKKLGHATNLVDAAMPQIVQRNRLIMVLLALTSSAEFKHPPYHTGPFGSDTRILPRNFFEVAKQIKPAPQTVALVGADAEFSNSVLRGARESVKEYDLKIVYDRAIHPRPSISPRSCAPFRRPSPTSCCSRPIRWGAPGGPALPDSLAVVSAGDHR
jgi:hypothetical protein